MDQPGAFLLHSLRPLSKRHQLLADLDGDGCCELVASIGDGRIAVLGMRRR